LTDQLGQRRLGHETLFWTAIVAQVMQRGAKSGARAEAAS
jgi:hypothetical protein